MKKKIFTLFLCVALLAVAVVGGTMAYFTDTAAADNVFVVGNVDMTLYESYLHRAGVPYQDNVPASLQVTGSEANGYVSDAQIIAASGSVYTNYLSNIQLMPGIAINKMPYVKNTGSSDAFVRIRVMIPAELNGYLDASNFCSSACEEEFTAVLGENYAGVAYEDANGKNWAVYTFTRNAALTPNEMTYWNVWNTIEMDADVTSDELQTAITNGWITRDADTGALNFNVRIEVDAIQAASFANADAAWVAFDAQ